MPTIRLENNKQLIREYGKINAQDFSQFFSLDFSTKARKLWETPWNIQMMEVKHVTNMTMNFCSEELWFCRDYWDLSRVLLYAESWKLDIPLKQQLTITKTCLLDHMKTTL